MRALLVYLIAAATLAVGAWFGFPQLFGEDAEQTVQASRGASAPPPSVIVAEAGRRPFEDHLEALGTVRANESVEITPNSADHVAVIHFVDGQEVEAGQLLVEMNTEEERARLAEATALRDERKVNYEQTKELFEQEMSPKRELDNAFAMLAAAEARVIGLEASIADRQVRAPFSGTLGLRRISEGAYLQPSSVITTLDDLSVVKVDFTVPEAWFAHIRPGMTIAARGEAAPDVEFRGEVVVTDTRLDPRTRAATVRAVLPNPDRLLRPGMLLRVMVERGDEPVLQVPEEAIIPIGQKQFVFVVDAEEVARRVEITVGRRRVGAVEVLAGLSVGDRVVIEGIVSVRPDAPVRVVETRSLES